MMSLFIQRRVKGTSNTIEELNALGRVVIQVLCCFVPAQIGYMPYMYFRSYGP